MVWFDFSALPSVIFNMTTATGVAARYFLVVEGAMDKGVRAANSYIELDFPRCAFVPRAPKNFYSTLPLDKRERDFCLVWFPSREGVERLITAKLSGNRNAGRILDVQRNKWFIVAKEWDYGRQGNIHGVIGEMIDELPPADLPPPA